jgi:molybdopterin/thiamine biosynthesis adenylyltransferase
MNRAEFYKRVVGVIAPERLQSRRVVVVGVGSGGSRVAAELARLGVDLILADRPGELIEEHNIVRHLLGYPSLGKSKLGELKRHLRRLYPFARVRTCALDVVDDSELFLNRLNKWQPDLLAVCTDNEQSKHAVNQAALRLGIPQVGAGVYDGGIGGEVYRVRAGAACYGCIAAHLRLHRPATAQRPSFNYEGPEPFLTQSACALNLDIEQIALLQSRLALEFLLGDPDFLGLPVAVNLLVFANRLVPGTFSRPFHCEFFSISRQPSCLDCGDVAGDLDQKAERIVTSLQAASEHLSPHGS